MSDSPQLDSGIQEHHSVTSGLHPPRSADTLEEAQGSTLSWSGRGSEVLILVPNSSDPESMKLRSLVQGSSSSSLHKEQIVLLLLACYPPTVL